MMDYYFKIQVSKLKGSNYLIILPIYKLESDKDLIRKLADYDPLTNIYSRVKFNEIFPKYINNCYAKTMRYSQLLFLI